MPSVVLTQPVGGWDTESIAYGATPPVVTGDSCDYPAAVSPGGYTLTIGADGIPVIDAHGDASRQSFPINVYDASALAYYGVVTFYVNNVGPVLSDPSTEITLNLSLNVLMASRDLSTLLFDAEGDALTLVALTALATGLDLTANVLSGTPTVVEAVTSAIRAYDIAGDYTDFTITQDVGGGGVMRLRT